MAPVMKTKTVVKLKFVEVSASQPSAAQVLTENRRLSLLAKEYLSLVYRGFNSADLPMQLVDFNARGFVLEHAIVLPHEWEWVRGSVLELREQIVPMVAQCQAVCAGDLSSFAKNLMIQIFDSEAGRFGLIPNSLFRLAVLIDAHSYELGIHANLEWPEMQNLATRMYDEFMFGTVLLPMLCPRDASWVEQMGGPHVVYAHLLDWFHDYGVPLHDQILKLSDEVQTPAVKTLSALALMRHRLKQLQPLMFSPDYALYDELGEELRTRFINDAVPIAVETPVDMPLQDPAYQVHALLLLYTSMPDSARARQSQSFEGETQYHLWEKDRQFLLRKTYAIDSLTAEGRRYFQYALERQALAKHRSGRAESFLPYALKLAERQLSDITEDGESSAEDY
jgi:hypothetical protein